ncbi:hypothetical protein MK805_05350 [Shimazuella sp. AN120528]|uniref:alpha/beta hydrolase n=1 Tax=Shimazuella soli TaxID=1892854 RepID=UPI001F0FC975|nr:hypothetical protein [Shimazuella soli]MCH5584391.1 hypothetical protein [Shimazuella soli]
MEPNQLTSTPITIQHRRQKRTKIIIVSLFLCILLAFFVTCFISYQIVNTMSHHTRDRNVFYELNPQKFPYEKVAFKSAKDNVTLYGYYFPSQKNGQESEKTIIVVHGYTSNRLVKGRTPKLVQNLVPQGYNVLAFDPRAQGESEGNQIKMGVDEKYDFGDF